MVESDLAAMVCLLQAHTPLERLSNMEARTVFEFMECRGFKVSRVQESEAVRFSDSITVRCQPEVRAAIDDVARQRGMKPSEYHRQALLTGLRLDGFELAGSP